MGCGAGYFTVCGLVPVLLSGLSGIEFCPAAEKRFIDITQLAGQGEADWGIKIFIEAESGLFADSHTAGNIGMPILRSFRVILDYQNERIALIPKED